MNRWQVRQFFSICSGCFSGLKITAVPYAFLDFWKTDPLLSYNILIGHTHKQKTLPKPIEKTEEKQFQS
jgi:hypothetical protein